MIYQCQMWLFFCNNYVMVFTVPMICRTTSIPPHPPIPIHSHPHTTVTSTSANAAGSDANANVAM